jgi:hypothetical protein
MSPTIIKDLRPHFGPARDQGPRPTCMAFAASDAHAGVRPGWEPLSVEWAYYHALQRDGAQPHEGLSLSAMLAMLHEDGQPVEAVWPYIAALFTDIPGYAPPTTAAPLYRRRSAPVPAALDDIIASLDKGRPVLFTMSVSRSFYAPSVDGVISAHEPLEPRIHAVVAVGHGLRGGNRFVLIRNSWGNRWGLHGHAWLDATYLAPRLLVAAILAGEP